MTKKAFDKIAAGLNDALDLARQGDIVARLRAHVNNRGGASLQNGAWQMMLDAADEIERLRSLCINREEFIAHKELWGEFGAWIAEPPA